jgi:N-acetylmuramoyl-L-alanine amidase
MGSFDSVRLCPTALRMKVGTRRLRASALTLALLSIFTSPAGSAGEKRLTVYSATTSFSLPVVDREGREYVGLFEILEPLGTATSRSDGLHWKVRYDNADSEFTAGKNRAKVRGHDVDLAGNFLLESGRGLVPLGSLGALLPRLLGSAVNFNEAAHRLFVGNVGTHFTAQLSHTAPPRLVMNFTSAVNPTISTEPGKLRMVFNRDPVVAPGSPTLTFGDKTIPSANFAESNGTAEIVVNGSVPLMASFSSDGHTITIAAAPQPPVAQTTAVPQPSSPPPSASTAAGGTSMAVTAALAAHYYIVVDASHGGDDRGAQLSAQLAEKDVCLALARRLRQELELRGISTLVLRDPDATLTLDQRAVLTNAVRPAIYVSMHAASDGKGVRLYTSLLPSGGENNGPFVAWDTAQSQFLPISQTAAQAVASELQKKQIQVRTLAAPLRPLNNVTTAAIAVEVAPPGSDVMDLNLPVYQQNVVSAVAGGIVAVRDKLGTPR